MDILIKIDDSMVEDLIITAVEGGSNYWCDFVGTSDGDAPYYKKVMSDGFLKCRDKNDNKIYKLDKEAIIKGMNVMMDGFPHVFGNFISEMGDSFTGDVFLQCCLFGDVIYG